MALRNKLAQMIKEYPDKFDAMDCRPVEKVMLQNFASTRLLDIIQSKTTNPLENIVNGSVKLANEDFDND